MSAYLLWGVQVARFILTAGECAFLARVKPRPFRIWGRETGGEWNGYTPTLCGEAAKDGAPESLGVVLEESGSLGGADAPHPRNEMWGTRRAG